MDNELIINENVIFVKGAHCGAIYNFNDGKVYKVNNSGCDIIYNLYNGNKEKNYFVDSLVKANLLNKELNIFKFVPNKFEEIKLELAWLEVTEACNLRCVHCYEGECHLKKNESLSVQQWKNIIDQLVMLKVERVVIIGGEPSCYKNIEQIIDYCGLKHIPTTYFTNATMISDEIFQSILRNNVSVKVSIYGHNALIHDSITKVKGSFDKLVTTIDKMIAHGISVYPAIVIMRENENYIEEIKNFIREHKMTYKRYDVIRNVFGGTQNNHTPLREDVINSSYYKTANFKTNFDSFCRNHFINTCWYGKIAIQENGNVIPCVFERTVSLGNCNDNSLLEILNNNHTRKNWFLPLDEIKICKDCEYRYCCKDCRALGISVKGDKYDKNPRCKYNPYTGVWE